MPDPEVPTSATVSPGATVSVKSLQHRLGRRVAERHVVEPHLAVRHLERHRVGLVLHERRRVEEVEDAFGAGAGELTDGEDGGELPHRRRELEHVRREREERAEADVAFEREPAAEREHRDLTEGRDRLHRRLQPGLHVHEPDPRREHAPRPVGQPVELARFLAEALHDPDAGHVFFDDVGDVAGLLLRVPARREHRGAQAASR